MIIQKLSKLIGNIKINHIMVGFTEPLRAQPRSLKPRFRGGIALKSIGVGLWHGWLGCVRILPAPFPRVSVTLWLERLDGGQPLSKAEKRHVRRADVWAWPTVRGLQRVEIAVRDSWTVHEVLLR